MYKKIFSAILFGVLTVASTSTFVSCKDYDDDIDNLQNRIAVNDEDNKALHDALAALQAETASLKTQLEQKEGELKALIASAQASADAAQADIDEEVARAKQAEAALEARIAKCEETEKTLQGLIDDLAANKVDKTEFEAKVKDIYTSLESIETQLGAQLKSIEALKKGLSDEELAREAAVKDLQEQIDALDKYAKALEETQIKDNEARIAEIKKLREDLEAAIKDLETAKDNIEDLQARMETVEKKVVELGNQISTLNVMILRSLRSIVFIPDFYYWGIEATELSGVYIKYWQFKDMPEVSADKKDPTWDAGTDVYCYDYKGHSNKQRTEEFIVENFVARYHLNPSTADLSKASINILQADRQYVTRTAAVDKKNTNIKVASFDYEHDIDKGDLNLNLTITNPSLVKNIGHIETTTEAGATQRHFVQNADEKGLVTVFATEVELNDENKNTVTSDYAALRANVYANGYRLAHTEKGDPSVVAPMTGAKGSYTGVVNKTAKPDDRLAHICNDKATLVCTPCDLGTIDNRHLFTDADETVYGLDAQIKTLVSQPLVQAMNATTYSTTTAQDVVYYDGTINLSKLAEVHRIGDDKVTETLMSAAQLKANGFEIRFELTGLFMSGNKTSESAHASIKVDDNGDYILRPQLPKMQYQEDGQNIGVQDEWGAEQSRTNIGRTPLVRVLLVDTKNNDRVLDYGYIRLVIVEKPTTIIEDVWTVTYNTGATPTSTYYNYACSQPATSSKNWEQKWGSFEYDLYHLAGLSQVDFDNRYDEVFAQGFVYKNGTAIDASKALYGSIITGAFAQYLVKEKTDGSYTFTEAPEEDYVGIISKKVGTNIGDGTNTDVIRWVITGNELYNLTVRQYLDASSTRENNTYTNDGYLKEKHEVAITRAIKFQVVDPADRTKLRDIFVILKADPAKSAPNNDISTLAVNFDTNKIKEYWYDENTQKTSNTKLEAHLNVPSPEDWITTWQDGANKPFQFQLSYDFVGNNIIEEITSETIFKKYITVDDKTPNKDFSYAKYKGITLQFDPANKDKQFTGHSGKKYTLSVGKDDAGVENWALFATTGGVKQKIAYLEYVKPGLTSINNVKIVLVKDDVTNHINSYAEDLLNANKHDKLDDSFLKVLLGVKVKYDCHKFDAGSIQVRFLRPVNLFSEDKRVQDAAKTTQIISLYDIIKLTDWRDQWNPTTTSDTIKKRTLFPIPWVQNPSTGKYTVDYWYYYNIKEIHVGKNPVVDVAADGYPLNGIMETNMNQNDTTKYENLASITENVEFTYLKPTKIEEVKDADGKVISTHTSEIGEPNYYGRIKYTNNRSNVDEFDVKIPVTVCYEWGHLSQTIKIHIVKTLNNTDVKAY